MKHDAVPRLSGPVYYLLAVIVIVTILAGISWYTPEQDNKTSTASYASENMQTNVPVQPQTELQISFDDFLSALEREQQNVVNVNLTTELLIANHGLSAEGVPSQNEADVAQANRTLLDAQQLQKEADYRQLIADFNQIEGDEKVLLLQKIWQLAPEVGIDESLLTLLHLATHDSDARIERMAEEVLSDLTRFMDGEVQPEVQLVSQITEIDKTQQRNADLVESNDGTRTLNSQELNRKNSASSVEMIQQRNAKINQLTRLALSSENANQRDYALTNLMQFNHDSALEVIQHQLLNSEHIDERFRAIEKLRAAAGEINSMKLRRLLEIAANDYQSSIAEYAQASMTMLDQYDNNVSENSAVGVYPIDIQEQKICRPCGI